MKDSGRLAVGIALASSSAVLLDGCTGNSKNNESTQPEKLSPQPVSNSAGAKFTDITVQANLDFRQRNGTCERRYFIEQVAAGAVMFDANGDGHLDIYFPQPKPIGTCKKNYKEPLHHRLYINDGKGNFTLKPNAFGGVETDYGIAAAVGDYDNDGHPDLYVCCYGKNKLFKNRGDGTFEDVTEKSGLAMGGFSTGAVWFDYDNDGHLDLFVCQYCEWSVDSDRDCFGKDGKPDVCSPTFYKPAFNALFHNNGDGTFTNVTATSGVGKVPQRSLGVAAADFHGEGRLDLFVGNDMGQNFLYRNMGKGVFEEVGAEEGVAYARMNMHAQANMGVAVGDYNEDGFLDVLVTTFSGEPYTLYKNEGGKGFTDVSQDAGTAEPTIPFLGFGCGFLDTRNLGRLDLMFANGHVNPYIHEMDPQFELKQRNQLLLNDGNGKFTEDLMALPADDVRVHRGMCVGDINNDGRLDVLYTAADDRPTLLRNDTPNAGNWLMLKLTDKHGCCTPVGTKCVATIGGKKKLRVLLGGGSYGGDSDSRIHFGLGAATTIEKLEITWLSGKKQVLDNVKANQILPIKEEA
ncbi:MAG: CRTAC1 family protein [Chthonomonadales bacterium]